MFTFNIVIINKSAIYLLTLKVSLKIEYKRCIWALDDFELQFFFSKIHGILFDIDQSIIYNLNSS